MSTGTEVSAHPQPGRTTDPRTGHIDAGGFGSTPDWCVAEELSGIDRIVVAPTHGPFVWAPTAPEVGRPIRAGECIGSVRDVPVRCPFEGVVVGCLVAETERVRQAQPLLWLQVAP